VIRILTTAGLLSSFLFAAGPAAQAAQVSPAAEAGRLVALTDQQYENLPAARIRVMDPAVADWNTATAQKWSWSPTSGSRCGRKRRAAAGPRGARTR
jgi:hypothetical protein